MRQPEGSRLMELPPPPTEAPLHLKQEADTAPRTRGGTRTGVGGGGQRKDASSYTRGFLRGGWSLARIHRIRYVSKGG